MAPFDFPSQEAGSVYFSSTYTYDPRQYEHRAAMDASMRQEFLNRLEREFMEKMEERIWHRIESMRSLQEKYEKTLAPPLCHEYTGDIQLKKKIKDAVKNTVFINPLSPEARYGVCGTRPLEERKVYGPPETLNGLWKETDEWLSTVDIG